METSEISDHACNGLKVSESPTFICRNCNPNVMVFGCGPLGIIRS